MKESTRRHPPRLFFSFLRMGVFFYFVLAIIQLIFYLLSPSFYVPDPSELIIPSFIKWAFGREFLLILILYACWGILLGAWNFLWAKNLTARETVLGETKVRESALPTLDEKKEEAQAQIAQLQAEWTYYCDTHRGVYSLLFIQFFCCWLFLGWMYPAVLHQYPYTRDYPVLFSFAGLLLIIFCFSVAFLLQRGRESFFRNFIFLVLGIALPLGITYELTRPRSLALPVASSPESNIHPNILLLGFDALNGDDGRSPMESFSEHQHSLIFRNAFTPLPLTHPAWNSILTGLYPPSHHVRYFFDSPYPSKYPELYLPKILKSQGYASLFASDQPETSYFDESEGFNDHVLKTIGWRAHLQNTLFNHFVFPALWLNNRYSESLTGKSWNFANLFNFEPSRFFNFAFKKYAHLAPDKKLMALHTCFLHTPIQLTGEEARKIPDYWWLAPKNFFFQKWPKSGEKLRNTPANWVQPYPYRRASTIQFLNALLQEMDQKNYFKNTLTVFLSDHGERFIENRESYGGVHGVDLETREQMNVLLTWVDPLLQKTQEVLTPVSLVDIAPSVLERIGIDPKAYPFEGLPLVDQNAQLKTLPSRPIWIESMGYIDDNEDQVEFPQIGVKTLEKSLTYHLNGAVTVGEDYYQRIISKKLKKDAVKTNLVQGQTE